MNPKPHVSVDLSLAHTERGGNTADGKYFFSFVRNRIVIGEPDTRLTFRLSAQTSKDFHIVALISSDARGQLSAPELEDGARAVSVVVKNDQDYLLQVGVLVLDAASGETIVCDPQVICRPKPGP